MNEPKVSICIPAYRQPELLRKLLDSILIQTYQSYEIVVTDDSPDSSVEDICAEYIAKKMPLRYIKNTERKGTPENWNEAIRSAKGEYIKMMHHDDWFSKKDSLSKFVEMLDRNPKADFAFSGSLWYNPDGKLQATHKARGFEIFKLRRDPEFLFAANFISTPSATIFQKKINVFFDPRFKHVVDFDFYIQILKKNRFFGYTKEPLVGILIESSGQMTAQCLDNKNIRIPEYFNLYKKNHPEMKEMKLYVFAYFMYLFYRFNIGSIEDLRSCGIEGPIPKKLIFLLWLQRAGFSSVPVSITLNLRKLKAFLLRPKK